MDWTEKVADTLTTAKIKVVDLNIEKSTVSYSEKIKQYRVIKSYKGLRSDVKNRHQTFHTAGCPA